jgi:hypothetical protein
MKATLEYDLPDEQDEFEKAVNGGKYAYIIWELDHFLRAKPSTLLTQCLMRFTKPTREQETNFIRY